MTRLLGTITTAGEIILVTGSTTRLNIRKDLKLAELHVELHVGTILVGKSAPHKANVPRNEHERFLGVEARMVQPIQTKVCVLSLGLVPSPLEEQKHPRV